MKKLLCIVLSAVMVMAYMPVMAFAQTGAVSPTSEDDLKTALENGGEVILGGSFQLTANLLEVSKSVTLDLNGNTLTAASGKDVLKVMKGASLTIKDSSSAKQGKITGGNSAVIVGSETGSANNSKLIIDGGTLEGEYYSIVGNGLRDGTTITINGGVIKGTNNADSVGIYHPQAGTLNITGGKVEGLTGVQICDGVLNMTGGEILANKSEEANAPYKSDTESDGTIMDGSALSVVSRGGGYGSEIKANISGGTLKTSHVGNPAIHAYSWKTTQGSDGKYEHEYNPESIPNVFTASITGGTFKAGTVKSDVSVYFPNSYYSQDDAGVVSYNPPAPTPDPDEPKTETETKPDGSTVTTTTQKDTATGVESKTVVVKDKDGKTTATAEVSAPAKVETTGATAKAEVSKAAAGTGDCSREISSRSRSI